MFTLFKNPDIVPIPRKVYGSTKICTSGSHCPFDTSPAPSVSQHRNEFSATLSLNMSAEDFKAKGNAALQAKNFKEAVAMYTEAIALDGTNHV